jgi:GT2 family glycosyltransferase
VFKRTLGENYQPMRLGKDFHIDVPIKGEIIECDAHGFGITLLKREVFDEIEPPFFERLPHPCFPTIMYGHDVSFSVRAKMAGLKIYSHFGAKVKHACVGWLDYNHHFDVLMGDDLVQEIFDTWDSNEEVILSG